ncbi:uncharacterized protein N7446_005605 [Penicillium canescens]|uniref:Uncharacterized protein n=1 Tax=Penicillium canescens TaxID=5083 RepID=A0AAD6II43_PENCN|nr:uncharacterized protein N7446_005605 [Penicillium canescens]KAJ6050153.1 hypothetical protein N7444_006869 [Penicillium canescens]KAJ6050977.1 hypothetical protein N7460_001511 [Penicillium canescens]KAJ6061485.1 hypothetical protein N7446_005605 [Penicillium canescens]
MKGLDLKDKTSQEEVKTKPQDSSSTTKTLNNLQTQLNAMNEELKKSPTTQDLTKLQGQQNKLEHDVEEFKTSP